ncbi:MAG: hypothetical protein IKQ80_02440 [Clostridia bacterium]|nr:hypothetical protein [Clostridia bacterium]
MKRVLATILSLALIIGLLGVLPAVAEEAAAPVAYIMYANADWSSCFWMDGNEYPVKATTAEITGPGQYTVGLEFNEEAQGLAFTALGIVNGENLLPGYTIEINAIRVNGEAIEVGKGYTSSDDGVETRMNIYNEWVSELPTDARSFDGAIDDASPIIVNKDDFAAVKSVEIDFTLHQFGVDRAYIMYANADWSSCFWMDGNEYPVTATVADIDGFGDYTVGLEFAEPAEGLAFTALGIVKGEKTYPGAYIRINTMRVNGEAIDFTKGYTSSDDGVETRMNIYNEWVSELPTDARSFDGKLDDAAPIIVDKALFASVKSFEIDFSLLPVTDTAYIMYANADWSSCFWMDGNEYPVQATTAEITGPGEYTVGLEFNEEAQGLAFTALGVVTGEKTFNGYFIDITEIKVNGEPIALGKGYTSSDDGVEMRENIYNEWVSDLPADARRADGDLEGASPIIVDKEAFASVKSVEITFNFIYGKPVVKDAAAPLTQEEADALKQNTYNAYIGVQGKDTYVFRNSWDEAEYGRDSAEHPEFFGRLTGWDADNNAVDYGGSFEDAQISGDGEYTVSFTTGDMGMGETADYNMLFVSTDIPSALVRDGYLTIDNVKVKFGAGATQEYTEVDTEGEYVAIKIIDVYNQAEAPAIVYSVPGANETVSITFTVSNW